MFYQVWSLSMIHMLISWLKYVEMLAVVQIVTLRFEGGNDFEIYTHPRTIGHSHRLGDKRSTVVYGIHMAFTWHSLHNSFLAKTSGKCFPRVFHVFSTCCYVQRFTPRHWWPKSTHNPQKVQSSESWELFGSFVFWSRKTKKLRKTTLKRLWRYLQILQCAFMILYVLSTMWTCLSMWCSFLLKYTQTGPRHLPFQCNV